MTSVCASRLKLVFDTKLQWWMKVRAEESCFQFNQVNLIRSLNAFGCWAELWLRLSGSWKWARCPAETTRCKNNAAYSAHLQNKSGGHSGLLPRDYCNTATWVHGRECICCSPQTHTCRQLHNKLRFKEVLQRFHIGLIKLLDVHEAKDWSKVMQEVPRHAIQALKDRILS